MKKTISLIILSIFGLPFISVSAEQSMDLNKMRTLTENLQGHHIKLAPFNPRTLGPALSDEAIDPWVFSTFSALKNLTFGSTPIGISACSSCLAESDPMTPHVYLNNNEVKEIFENTNYSDGKAVVAFIIAHEISHYVYESSISDGFSINGHLSFLYGGLLGKLIYRWQTGRWDDYDEAHSEVDAYALILLKRLGYKKPVDVITLLETFEGRQSQIRSQSAQAVMDRLW